MATNSGKGKANVRGGGVAVPGLSLLKGKANVGSLTPQNLSSGKGQSGSVGGRSLGTTMHKAGCNGTGCNC